jgi:hypothetical protein
MPQQDFSHCGKHRPYGTVLIQAHIARLSGNGALKGIGTSEI